MAPRALNVPILAACILILILTLFTTNVLAAPIILSDGELVGIIVGSIAGAVLVGYLLFCLFWCCVVRWLAAHW